MNCLAIIPARGGSKGIPGKNIIDVNGKPLIGWAIEEALKVPGIKRVLVSTDDAKIAEVARRYGSDIVAMRPAHLAEDKTPTLPVLQYHLEQLEKSGETFDSVMTLQPTSPLRKAWHINEALEMFAKDAQADSLVSMRDIPHSMTPECAMLPDEGYYYPLNQNGPLARQSAKHYYARNGVIYLSRWSWLKNWQGPGVIGGKILGQIMDPITSIDIDDPTDLEMARVLGSQFKFDNGVWTRNS